MTDTIAFDTSGSAPNRARESAPRFSGDIAIVGMAATVPGAQDIDQFWRNLAGGVESIQPLSEVELLEAGEDPARLRQKNYVRAAAKLDGFAEFDAEFFGFGPKEAAILDPQHRKFLEVTWAAMEQAGHAPRTFPGKVGVYAGCGMGSYFYFNICSNPDLVDDVGMFLLRHTGNDKDFLSTRVSHVFDLKGPSVNMQTACSTSLVAVHYARQALMNGECDMALAGGVTIELPQGRGYLFKENEILSPDGHCHAFDHRAEGTVFGSGAGAVALRRLEDAVADGDHIWAVIKGSAINNDGAAKAGYLAPSVDGQAEAIEAALRDADVRADSIGYIECHGTGTYLGDPIEVAALTEAHRTQTDKTGYCQIGSVKTNIGHLDTAAGVVGLIKSALALHHRQIPPSLSYEAPNPTIDFDDSPFRVADRLVEWASNGEPRRAAVNSLGVGGTNAHVILQEAPSRAASEESDFPFHILCLSGRSKSALEANTAALAAHLGDHAELPLADVAHTLKNGRYAFDKRRIVVAETASEAARLLDAGDPLRVFTHDHLGESPDIVFMFPGGGAQYPGMARDLYETEPVFAEWMDRGLAHLEPQLDYDIRALWLPDAGGEDAAAQTLKQPSVQLPLIMIVEYALAQLWHSWGVRPAALVGHSMGENTAACLAGVIGFEDCIDLVLLRGRLFDTVAPGGMLSVSLPLEELEPLIGDDLDIASVNAPRLCAVSGPQASLDALGVTLTAQDIDFQRVAIDIAAHSRMLDGILPDFRAFLETLNLQAPKIPFLSNRTGAYITDQQATDPEYWVQQLRNTVHFADCIKTLSDTPRVFLEVGPGKALSSLTQMGDNIKPGQVLSALRHPDQDMADDAYFLQQIGRLWACGIEADWDQIWGEARRNRVLLPGYQFQRSRYFIEPGRASASMETAIARYEDMTDWGMVQRWKPAFADCDLDVSTDLGKPLTWLVFCDEAGVSGPVIERLRDAGHTVSIVRSGDSFQQRSVGEYILSPEQGVEGYEALLSALSSDARLPDRIAHFWLVTGAESFRPGSSFFDRNIEHGFTSLLHLAQAMGAVSMPGDVHISVVTSGAARVGSEGLAYPEKACVLGPVGVMPREFPGVTISLLDIETPEAATKRRKAKCDTLTPRLLEDMLAEPGNAVVAYRGDKRMIQGLRAAPLEPGESASWKDGGAYLITGGFGGIGLSVARDMAKAGAAHIVLLARSPLPPRGMWDQYSGAGKTATRIKAIQQIEAKGAKVHLIKADVTDLAQMQAAAGEIAGICGRLTGIIHAAGTIDDAPMLTKDAASVQTVFAPKIGGLRVLDAVFADGAVDVLVLFSSTSTITCPAGQVDYVAANAYLNAVAHSRQGGQTRVVAVNWGVWADTGMAADAMARRMGEGDETPRTLSAPLLNSAEELTEGTRFDLNLSARDDWVLAEHRTRTGQTLLPGTGVIELAAEAVACDGAFRPFELCDLYFLRAFSVEGISQSGHMLMVPDGATQRLELRSDIEKQGRHGTVLHAEAQLRALPDEAPQIDIDAITARCDRVSELPFVSPQEAHLDFGPRWRTVQSAAFGKTEGLARLALPDAAQGDLAAGFLAHPALLDLATGWAVSLHDGYDPSHLWVPAGYGALRLYRPLPAEVVSWVQLGQGGDADTAVFDIVLATPDGRVVFSAKGFRMRCLASARLPARADLSERDIDWNTDESTQPLSRSETRLMHNISLGITAEEGPEALRRALARPDAQIAISSLNLPALVAEAGHVQAEETGGAQSFERPDLDSDYIAPETGTERQLADIWSALLGIEQVGIADSFFDLGGHSLLAVRLFAQVKRSFGVDFPLSVLFEAPTIADLAKRLPASDGPASDDGMPDAPALEQPKHRHLVALHPDMSGSRTPMFIVAGMFGNVLNLRHLALLMGRDRPVWGLQARGLIGDEAPHQTIEQAAKDYITEMRSVQPVGPYYIGGFSGGGITAYEIAQQLRADGQKVGVLAMLDTPLPRRPTLSRADKALIKMQELRRKGPSYLMDWARARIAWEMSKRRNHTAEPSTAGSFNNAGIEAAFRAAVSVYEPRPWHGPLTLFRPRLDRHWKVSGGNWVSSEREYVFEDNQWTQYAPETEVIEVPGNHDSMVLVPNVSVLAGHLNALTQAADLAVQTGDKAAGSDDQWASTQYWANQTAAE
ncbi:SDR family NAD(P)-dependent oxidoreductase [Roseovarius aestuarii]|nr:SDR family NAD(P)-dependent oxidoreductase [Roseovarius aestuarii]